MNDLFRSYLPLSAPGIGDGAGNVDHPMIFSSGMSRRSDFEPALRADHSIGVDVNELSDNAIAGLARELAVSSAYLFVDSGAFAAFRAGNRGAPRAVDFDRVFARYDKLALAVSRADPSGNANDRIFYVLPDVVGDQAASLEALANWASLCRDYNDCANAIIPVQRGDMSIIEYFDFAAAILGRDDLVIGVPSAFEAVSNTELLALLAARPSIYGVHILGAASEKKAGPRLEVLREAGFDGAVTLDANRLRGYWNAYSSRPEALARLLAGLPPKRRDDERMAA